MVREAVQKKKQDLRKAFSEAKRKHDAEGIKHFREVYAELHEQEVFMMKDQIQKRIADIELICDADARTRSAADSVMPYMTLEQAYQVAQANETVGA